ncbi:MAG: hypothetical protein AB1696_19935 [Planctomycetota bacterium]
MVLPGVTSFVRTEETILYVEAIRPITAGVEQGEITAYVAGSTEPTGYDTVVDPGVSSSG